MRLARVARSMQARQHGAMTRAKRTSWLREALAPGVDLLFPPRCPLCGEAIAVQKGLCSDCWAELAIPGDPSCATCQRPLRHDFSDGESQCAPCLANPPRHDGIAAGTLYNDASRQLILSFKHGRRIGLAPTLAQLMVARLPEPTGNMVLVPVPLHRFRLWKRGYNQAVLLADEMRRVTGLPVLRDALIRTKPTPSLGGLGKKARGRALSGALRVARRHQAVIEGADVVLVDDVLTSGATSDACVKQLKRAGARSVVVACFARVMNEAIDLTESAPQ